MTVPKEWISFFWCLSKSKLHLGRVQSEWILQATQCSLHFDKHQNN